MHLFRISSCSNLQSIHRCNAKGKILFHLKILIILLLFQEYLQNPTQNWLKKDTCIFLVLALASKGETQKFGITKTSSFISIPAFYASSILPELQNPDGKSHFSLNSYTKLSLILVNSLPLIKAACLKFLIDVRSQIDRDALLVSIPQCVRYLSSNNIVVQTYAAHAIERLLLVRHPTDSKQTSYEFLF